MRAGMGRLHALLVGTLVLAAAGRSTGQLLLRRTLDMVRAGGLTAARSFTSVGC